MSSNRTRYTSTPFIRDIGSVRCYGKFTLASAKPSTHVVQSPASCKAGLDILGVRCLFLDLNTNISSTEIIWGFLCTSSRR